MHAQDAITGSWILLLRDSIWISAGWNFHPYPNTAEVIFWINQCPVEAVCSDLSPEVDKSRGIIRTGGRLGWSDALLEPKAHTVVLDTSHPALWQRPCIHGEGYFFKTCNTAQKVLAPWEIFVFIVQIFLSQYRDVLYFQTLYVQYCIKRNERYRKIFACQLKKKQHTMEQTTFFPDKKKIHNEDSRVLLRTWSTCDSQSLQKILQDAQ